MSQQRVIVTGGSGYLGTHVRRHFNAEDMSRRSGIDICNDADARCISEYDVIIHMASLVDKRPEAAARAFTVNVDGTRKLLEHLRAGQTFIFCSTKDVYGNHIDRYEQVPESCSTDYCGQGAYEWSKLIAEKYVQFYGARAGVRVGIFRLSTVYAPATPGNAGGFVSFFARAVKNGEELKLKMKGEQIRDLLHVDDLSKAFEHFIGSDIPQGCFNIGGGARNALTLRELAEELARLSGREARLSLSDEPVREQIHYVTDIGLIALKLGWQPRISVTEGLTRLLQEQP